MYVYVCRRDVCVCVCVCVLTSSSSFFLHRRSSRAPRTIVSFHPMCGFGCVCLFGSVCVCVCVGDVVGGDEFGLDFVGGSVCVCVCV